jgi:hypothetical protein
MFLSLLVSVIFAQSNPSRKSTATSDSTTKLNAEKAPARRKPHTKATDEVKRARMDARNERNRENRAKTRKVETKRKRDWLLEVNVLDPRSVCQLEPFTLQRAHRKPSLQPSKKQRTE